MGIFFDLLSEAGNWIGERIEDVGDALNIGIISDFGRGIQDVFSGTARITGKDKEGCLIEAEVYGNGIIMWLLSQGAQIEVMEPESLRKKMKDTIKKMAEKYQ